MTQPILKPIFLLLLVLISCRARTPREELLKMKAVLDIILLSQTGRDEWTGELEKITGIDWEIIQPPHNQYSRKLKILFTSGNLPDICEIPTGDYVALASTNRLIPLNDLISRSDNLKSVDNKYYEAYRLEDGNIYGFPLNTGGGCVTYIRQDWLSALELEIPTTWEEFYAVIWAFTYYDPDGNGINDTVGYTTVLNNEFDYYNRMIMQDAMFDFYKKGDTWTDGFLEPEIIKALARYRKCYTERIIDPEFFTNETSTVRTKFYEGQVGIIEYWSGIWALRIDESLKDSGPPGAGLTAIPPIDGVTYLNRVAPCLAITKGAADPEKTFRLFIDLMHDKGAGQMLFTYGVEGVHYQLDDRGSTMLPAIGNFKRTFDKAYVHPELTLNDWKLPIELDPGIVKSREIHRTYSRQIPLPKGGEYFTQYSSEIMALKKELFARIVSGEYTIDEGLRIYKERARSFHLTRILNELNSKKSTRTLMDR